MQTYVRSKFCQLPVIAQFVEDHSIQIGIAIFSGECTYRINKVHSGKLEFKLLFEDRTEVLSWLIT